MSIFPQEFANSLQKKWEDIGDMQVYSNKSGSSTSVATSTSSVGRFCRICHEIDEPLLLACKCRGSVGLTHERCLVEWLSRCGKNHCELCGASYALRIRYARGWPALLKIRISKHDKAMILVNLICLLFLISTTAWLLWSAFSPDNSDQRANELYQACYALYGFLDIFCLGILVHEIPHMQTLWRRLKLLRYELCVLPHPSTKVMTSVHLENEVPMHKMQEDGVAFCAVKESDSVSSESSQALSFNQSSSPTSEREYPDRPIAPLPNSCNGASDLENDPTTGSPTRGISSQC